MIRKGFKMTDRIRKMDNFAVLSGRLMELEVTDGTDKNGKEYMRIKGLVQFGPTSAFSKRFVFFGYKYKKDSEDDNILYRNAKEWASSAIPASKGGDTYVTINGEINENNYVNSSGVFVESLQFSAKFFNAFDNSERCGYDIECLVLAVADEVVNDAPTGRGVVSLCGTSSTGFPVVIKKAYLAADKYADFERTYHKGDSFTAYIDCVPNSGSETKPVEVGFGQSRQLTSGHGWVEDVIVGGSPYYEEGDARKLDENTFKLMLVERANRNRETKERGSQSGSGNVPTSARRGMAAQSSRNSISGGTPAAPSNPRPSAGFSRVASDDDEDADFPF